MAIENARRRVGVIDSEALFRAALIAYLQHDEGCEVVVDAATGRAGIAATERVHPEVVFVGLTLSDLAGYDLIPALKRASPSTRVLVLSRHEGQRFVRRALHAGADGYLSKSSEPEELGLAIEAAVRGEPFLSSRIAGALMAPTDEPSHLDRLTPREREVLRLVAIGHANKDAARELGITAETVKKHRQNLQRKLGCHCAAELTRFAIKEGLLAP